MAEKEPHSSSYGTPGDDSALRDQCSRVQAKIVAAREKLRLVQASFDGPLEHKSPDEPARGALETGGGGGAPAPRLAAPQPTRGPVSVLDPGRGMASAL